MTYKVIQWTTGHVGREAVKGIMRHPELELVGCYAWSKDKAGKDVGELCGIEPTGVIATGDIEHLLAMDADCVCYMPTFPDIDEVERILRAGKNVVSSYFINARSWGPEVQGRLIQAAEEGGVSLFGSGIFPGFANFVAALMASASYGFTKIRFLESVDLTHYEAIANYANLGWGQPPEEKWRATNESVLGTYAECIDLIADLLHIPITEIRFDYESATATDDREFHGYSIPAGTIAGQKC
ncbi:MAG: dihydrodipicolinate reductase, partial [Halioglobus sp.]